MAQDQNQENIAATLARVLPGASIVDTRLETDGGSPALVQIAVPKTFDIKEIDFEKLRANPRRTTALAVFADPTSFVDYVKTFAQPGTAVWCDFNPQTFALGFTAVIDEHAKGAPGWRKHKATFTPDMSAEWKAWTGRNGSAKPFSQVAFAEWIEEHSDDIATANGLPTSLQMMSMATEFVASEESVFKSAVRLQSGGVRLTYVADPDSGTTATMAMFEKFAIGIPVFQGAAAADFITARLKYRLHGGSVTFHYELVRPDRVHENAAKELIATIRLGVGDVPVLMGTCA